LDEAQGAAADVSTASSQFGPGETVSDASQLAVTVEGSVRFTSFLSDISGVGVIDSNELPCTDTLSKPDPAQITIKTSPSCPGSPSDASSSSPTVSQAHLRRGIDLSPTSFNLQTPSRSLTCLLCPRSFKGQHELE
jgi:hypothetical protein